MGADELSQEQEEQIIWQVIRDRGGADPDLLGPVMDLTALGLVNSSWRNTCVESWHADARLGDGDMMRINSHMTWRVRQLLRRWMAETGLTARDPAAALDGVATADVEQLVIRLFRWLVSPGRKLVTGGTLIELAGDDLAEYEDDADHRRRQNQECAAAGDRWARSGFEFTTETGEALHPAFVTSQFEQLAYQAGLPPIRLHDLRHFAATLHLAAGVDIKIVQDLLGHSSRPSPPTHIRPCCRTSPAPPPKLLPR